MAFKMRGNPFKQTETKETTEETTKETTKETTNEVCMSCGAPVNNHPYRHPIFNRGTREEYEANEKKKEELKKFQREVDKLP